MTKIAEDPRIVFLDLETMGLKPDSPIVEIAMLITECNPDAGEAPMRVTAEFRQIVARDAAAWGAAEHGAYEMHMKNGLMTESICLANTRRLEGWQTRQTPPLYHVESMALMFLRQAEFAEKSVVIAGNSIHQDRIWIDHQMPRLSAFLHPYKLIDVSAVRGLVSRFVDSRIKDIVPSNENHRALGDCLDCMAELSMYLRALFVNGRVVAWSRLQKYDGSP